MGYSLNILEVYHLNEIFRSTYEVSHIHDAILDGLGAVDGELELDLLLLAALVLGQNNLLGLFRFL